MAHKAIRVLLADDHPLMRAGIRTTLTGEEDITLVGEAIDGDEARQLCQDLKPDVLLFDLRMPGPSPAQTVAFLLQRCPNVKVLVITAYDDDEYVRGLIGAGAVGYVLKYETPETMVRAIRTVMRGEHWFSEAVMERMARWADDTRESSAQRYLTERELEVLRLVVAGKTNKQIGRSLGISEKAVEKHLSAIFAKLDVPSRSTAAVWAVRNGLL